MPVPVSARLLSPLALIALLTVACGARVHADLCPSDGTAKTVRDDTCASEAVMRAKAESACGEAGGPASLAMTEPCGSFSTVEYRCCDASGCTPASLMPGGAGTCKTVETWDSYVATACGTRERRIEYREPCGPVSGSRAASFTCCAR